MKIARRRKTMGWFWVMVFIAFIAGLLFLMEWLGSERPQMVIEKSVDIPVAVKRTE
jgi:hypothetical protein